MKTLLFVGQMQTQADADKIALALSDTQVNFSIKLEDRCVVIEGRNDLVYVAKVAIREAGFLVD
jgi:hypothetical protein